ncbi:sodium channel subunit beta-4 isoform X1 [Pezoporus occidentalis]
MPCGSKDSSLEKQSVLFLHCEHSITSSCFLPCLLSGCITSKSLLCTGLWPSNGCGLKGLHVFALAFALEVSVGKTNTVMALNNSNVLLPCTFTTCIGFQDLVFTWYFNSTEMIYHGKIKSKASEPLLVARNPRVEFVGSTTKKDNNISILLKNVDFSDAGKYTCHVKNPKEKNAQHNATIFLTVVQKMVEADNTVTLIIVGVVGGLIGLLILFMLIKRVVLFIIKKTQDGKKECLVSSSGNDNTENGLAGSKAEQKAPPKA